MAEKNSCEYGIYDPRRKVFLAIKNKEQMKKVVEFLEK